MADITKIYLLNVPLENDYKNTLYFASAEAQINYFLTRVVHSSTNCSYQRKDNIIRYPKHFDSLLNCNYVMYQNAAYSNKWFFAFITDFKYVDDGRTDITIETDCLQTWLFDYVVKESFVEREHVADDRAGYNTVPEQLETGDYIANSFIKNTTLTWRGYLIATTLDLAKPEINGDDIKFPNAVGGVYNGVYSGVKYFYYATAAAINGVLENVAKAGQSDGITAIFIVPSRFIETVSDPITTTAVVNSDTVSSKQWGGELHSEAVITKPDSLNGYVPKNNKLFTYPYFYLLMSNNSGGAAIYHYEFFNSTNCDFKINFALTPGCSIRLIPLNYKGLASNNEEGLNLGKLPICNWTTDVYTNWLTQNAINIPLQYIGGAFNTVSGAASGAVTGLAVGGVPGAIAGGASGAVGGIMQIAGTVSEVYQHSLMPPQSEGNVNSGDVTFSQGDLTFTAYKMSIKAEYARIIDDYFTMFGYKINRVKVPSKNHRKRFWYTKTIDVNIDGAIPNKDIQVIKDCYNRGVTFWKSAADINNYSDDNSPV